MSEEKQYPLPCGEDILINFNFGDRINYSFLLLNFKRNFEVYPNDNAVFFLVLSTTGKKNFQLVEQPFYLVSFQEFQAILEVIRGTTHTKFYCLKRRTLQC